MPEKGLNSYGQPEESHNCNNVDTVDMVSQDHVGSYKEETNLWNYDTYEETVYSDNIKEVNVSANTLCKNREFITKNEKSENLNQECDQKCRKTSCSTQTVHASRYNIEDFRDDPVGLLHLTGMENYKKFMIVLDSLGPAAYHLRYEKTSFSTNLSVSNQFFLVLWKLRRSACDTELALHFNVKKAGVGNIFRTWILFMSSTWSLVDIWPSRELIDFYMPYTFKNSFPNTRCLIDGTEVKTERSKNPKFQQSLFSTYKNTSTIKSIVVTSPGGMISYVSPAYGGSTSDRQIIERSELWKKCQQGDLVLGDKGINVQDLFAPAGVTVGTPTFLKNGQLPHKQVLKDRKLSSRRVHVERVIGLVKSFSILSKRLNHYYVPLASEIIGVCAMLANFKENIMA